MKVSTLLFVITLFFIKPAFPQTKNTIKNERFRICREMKKSMVDELLKPWYPAAIDTVDGGFLSTFTYDFKPQGNQDKMIVTQARHVWSNAKAAELFPSIPWYKKARQLATVF